MPIEIRLLSRDNAALLDRVAEGVFDSPVDARWTKSFFAKRHHLVVAIEGLVVVGMVSAVDYVHPDKAPELWINEIGVAPSHQRLGVGRLLLDAMLAHARTLGCNEAWLAAEEENVAARALYSAAGGTPHPVVMYSFPLLVDP